MRCAHVGCFIVNQCLYAFNRNSSNHSGSSFFAEMSLMISSLSPFGAKSVSISVTKPNSYSLLVTFSIIFSLGFESILLFLVFNSNVFLFINFYKNTKKYDTKKSIFSIYLQSCTSILKSLFNEDKTTEYK